MDHVEKVAAVVGDDVVTWVRAHPQYTQIVEQLGQQALEALLKSAGL